MLSVCAAACSCCCRMAWLWGCPRWLADRAPASPHSRFASSPFDSGGQCGHVFRESSWAVACKTPRTTWSSIRQSIPKKGQMIAREKLAAIRSTSPQIIETNSGGAATTKAKKTPATTAKLGGLAVIATGNAPGGTAAVPVGLSRRCQRERHFVVGPWHKFAPKACVGALGCWLVIAGRNEMVDKVVGVALEDTQRPRKLHRRAQKSSSHRARRRSSSALLLTSVFVPGQRAQAGSCRTCSEVSTSKEKMTVTTATRGAYMRASIQCSR